MQNTPSLETTKLPVTDRALIRYLGAGYGHFAVALEEVQHCIASQKLLAAQRLVAALSLAADVTEDRVNAYLDGAKADLHPQYFDAEQAPAAAEPLQLTYQPATATNVL